MISSISLKNFQSHKDSHLEFSPGVNVIVGSSDSGKTAILRSLNWVLYNRPSGLSNISYWNRDKKGQPKGASSIEILKEDTIIKRIRSGNFNGYEICVGRVEPDKTLEAIGTDVPEEISKIFNLTEINIQKQMDAPFLLSESSSEVARFFNRIVRLDLIDRVLSNTENVRRRTGREIEETTSLADKLTLDLDQYSWIDDAEGQIQKAERRQERVDQKKNDLINISALVEKSKTQELIISAYKEMVDAEDLVSQALEINKSISEKFNSSGRLSYLISESDRNTNTIAKSDKIIKIERKLEEAASLNADIENRFDVIDKIEMILKSYKAYTGEISIQEKEILALEKKLPELCPYCGSPMKEKHNHG